MFKSKKTWVKKSSLSKFNENIYPYFMYKTVEERVLCLIILIMNKKGSKLKAIYICNTLWLITSKFKWTTIHNYKKCTKQSRREGFAWLYSQFYIQLVFKAPLCITLTISDQKIVSGSLFLSKKKLFQKFFFFFSIFY